jgi:hypothetical protein
MQSEPWYKSLGRVLWWVIRYVWAPFMVIGGLVLGVYGAVHPREVDVAALQLRSAQVPVLIGLGGGNSGCVDAQPCGSSGQRLYLVFPQVFLGGEVAVLNDASSGVTVTRRPLLAYVFFLVWGGCIYLIWRNYVHPLRQASNNRFERSRGSRLR